MSPELRSVLLTGAESTFGDGTEGTGDEFYRRIAKISKEAGLNPSCPYLEQDAGERTWQAELRAVGSSGLLVAYIGEPSLRVGQQIEAARAASVPTLLLAELEKQPGISRLILGVPTVAELVLYENLEELDAEMRFWLYKIISSETLHLAALENGWSYDRYVHLKTHLLPPEHEGPVPAEELGYRSERDGLLVPYQAADWVNLEQVVE